jgi:DNA-binding CsgD family transcriptional regulator
VILCALGLGLMGVWMNLVGYSPAFSPLPAAPEGQGQPELSRYAFYLGIVACGLMMAGANNRIPAIKSMIDLALVLVMCMGTAAFGISYQQEMFDPVLLACAGCFFSGIGYTWFILSFYLLLAERSGLALATAAILASLILETVAAMILSFLLPAFAQVLVGSIMPPAACFILIFIQRRDKAPGAEATDGGPGLVGGDQEHFMVLALLIAQLCLLLIRSLTSPGLWGFMREGFEGLPLMEAASTLASCIVLAVLGWLTLVRRSTAPLAQRYQMPMLIIIIGCLTYYVTDFTRPIDEIPIENAVIDAIELYGHLLNWTITVTALKILRFSKYRMLGLLAALYNVLAILWILFIEDLSSGVPTLVMFLGFCVVFFVAIAPMRLSLLRPRSPRGGEALVEALAAKHHLTTREQEILAYLKAGRSAPYIQKAMHLSAGTINTHIAHIYTKLAVHSRQELLDKLDPNNQEQE